MRLAYSDISDADAIRELGEGWVAEETWAIALYSAIRHIDSVEDAIIASVNHDGDSDSTGSVCGNSNFRKSSLLLPMIWLPVVCLPLVYVCHNTHPKANNGLNAMS